MDELDDLHIGMPDPEGEDTVQTPDDLGDSDQLDGEGAQEPQDQDNLNDSDDSQSVPTSDLSGIEQYLAQFNIEGGIIDFQDGSSSHFNELPADKQVEVLTKLHATSAQSIEERFGLDEAEIGLINYLRQQEGTIEEVIDQMAQQRAQMYISSKEATTMDVNAMTDDSIYTAFLLRSNPTATIEQLEKDLETAKQMSNFTYIVSNLKASMLKEQQEAVSNQSKEQTQRLYAEIEDQRKQVVNAVRGITEIDGLAVNDGIKNDVLDLILNVDEDGDSLFMTKVFGDPKELFRAAFWYKNGQDIINAREEYWKKEKSAAYKRGQADSGKRTFSATDVTKNITTPRYNDPSETISFDDLYT